MGYKVRYLVRGIETAHEFIGSRESAETLVERFANLEALQSAEVIDSDGTVVFRRPRVFPGD